MYFSTAGERLLQELKLMEALPEEPQRIKSALAVAEKLTLGLRNHYEANWHPHPAPGRLMKAPIAYAGSIGMTAGRPYQKAISRQQALRTISEGAGNQFDPILAGLFCAAQRNA